MRILLRFDPRPGWLLTEVPRVRIPTATFGYPPSMPLRPATLDEMPRLQRLMQQSMRTVGEAFYGPIDAERASRFLTIPDPDVISDGTFYVIESDGQPVACGGWSCRRKLFTGSTAQESLSGLFLVPGDDPARIRSFFVDPAQTRRGLGQQLFEACRDAALQAGFDRLELMATLPGVPFYTRLGFEAQETVAVELPDGLPLTCVRMTRGL